MKYMWTAVKDANEWNMNEIYDFHIFTTVYELPVGLGKIVTKFVAIYTKLWCYHFAKLHLCNVSKE